LIWGVLGNFTASQYCQFVGEADRSEDAVQLVVHFWWAAHEHPADIVQEEVLSAEFLVYVPVERFDVVRKLLS